MALLRSPGDAANVGGQARPQRSAAASSQRESRFLGNVGEPPAAERTAWRSDGSESQSHDRSSAREFREHRTELQRRIAVHVVGRRAPQAAYGEQLEGKPGRELPSPRIHAAAYALAAA